jgi:hypothetical protein
VKTKDLLKSQQELIRMKILAANQAQADLQATVKIVAGELGIPPTETWRLSADGTMFEKLEPPKEP